MRRPLSILLLLLALPCFGSVLLSIAPDPITNRFNVTLAWNPLTNPLVAGYNIYLLLDQESNAAVLYRKLAITNATCTFSNLPPGLECDFRATTYSAAGRESAQSPPAYYTTPSVKVPSFRISASAPATNWILQRSADLRGWISLPATNWPLVVSNNLPGAFYRLTSPWP